MKVIVIIALLLLSVLLFPACAVDGNKAEKLMRTDVGKSEENSITHEMLAGKRFHFYWKSSSGEGFNATARLMEDGTINGIGSPNESTWLIDEKGRLIFKHADGRISTTYDKVTVERGWFRFEGPFHFRDGITHILDETESENHKPLYDLSPEEADRIHYSKQSIVFLDPGETHVFKTGEGQSKAIKLKSVEEFKDSVVGLMRRAKVYVEINEKPYTLICAPYIMPTEVEGIRIIADTTSAWLNIPRRVQFSIWSASDPIVDTTRFTFPLPGYRLMSHGMQAYNEPVHLGHQDGDPGGGQFYHNYGVDFAGSEARQKVVSCITGEVVQIDRRIGELSIRDSKGFIVNFGHLDSILSGIELGAKVEQGQWVGMLGRRGASGNFAHLHVGTYLSDSDMHKASRNRIVNLYPWLMAAYEASHPDALHAVARPHKMALTGEKVRFSGEASLPFSSKIVSYVWEFHDGTLIGGKEAVKVYDKPGCYMATLRIEDDQGNRDVDFCKVKVYSRTAPEEFVPILFVTHTPTTDLYAGQPVYFRIWPQGLDVDNITVNFHDDTELKNYVPYSSTAHTFDEAGIKVVTVTGTSDGMPVTQRVKVVVH